MSLKTGILAAVSALGLLAAAPAAHADSLYWQAPARRMVMPVARYRHVRWAPRVVYAPPVVAVPQSVGYPIAQPAYSYNDGFVDQINRELSQLESRVRERVAYGELDGNALTTMESGRDDIRADLTDVSQKGFINDADRAHIESDVQALRQKLGC